MFETLFIYPAVLARHQTGPGSAERELYLAHCAGQGLARATLLRIARELLVVAERLNVTIGHQITRLEIEAAAGKWLGSMQSCGVHCTIAAVASSPFAG